MTPDSDGFLPLFLQEAARDPERIFASFSGRPLTFGLLHRMSTAFASALAGRGFAPGTRIAVLMNNRPETLAVLFGIARAGAIWVPINARLKGDGLRYVLEHCEARVIVADVDLLRTAAESGVNLSDIWTVVAGGHEDQLEPLLRNEAEPLRVPGSAAEDTFAVMYTSGTTGRPKGVIVTHRMMRLAGEAVALLTDPKTEDIFFVWEPLYHIGGAQLIVLPLIRVVQLSLVERFSASRFWHQVRAARATHIHYLGGILQLLLKREPRDDDRAHVVRFAWGAGCPKEIWRSFEERFGVEIRECYGMTEASSMTTSNTRGVVGSVGQPLPWFNIQLRDDAGRESRPGERGEIVVRTSLPGAIFPGYFRNPDATARALREGALHTGDLGKFDQEGNLLFLGRMTDSVRCRGENVSAWEVEHVATRHPGVEDCAMIGVVAEVGEQDIKLFVKPKKGQHLDFAELAAWLSERLAPYQVPRYLAEVAEFERTPSQRIMKHRLSPRLDDCWDRTTDTAADYS